MGASGEFHAVLPLWSACVYLSVSHSPLHLPPQCPCKLPLHWPHGGWIIWDLAGDVGLQLRESSQWSAAGRRRARGCSSSRLLRGTARRYRRGLHCGQGGGCDRRAPRGCRRAGALQGSARGGKVGSPSWGWGWSREEPAKGSSTTLPVTVGWAGRLARGSRITAVREWASS